ncbi:MAG TPA: Hsp70 family protein [Acidimicrobiales bacterium]|nr:Hsp70 family protein [Acidimicrobiales bacterium]
MPYRLGIDVGTTYTAAAMLREGHAEVASLGDRSAAIPSVIFQRPDDTILTGEAASRRGLAEPSRVARAFKRRIGDPTPIMVGGTPYSADALTAKLLRWVFDAVSEREGGKPEKIAVSHPANWGPYKKELLGQAIRMSEIGEAQTLTEPEAAAIYYSSTERVDPGQVVAVYDLGGGTFDAAVLRKTGTGFEILGPPEGIERLGGIDFDEAVLAHVNRSLDGVLEDLDPDDPGAVAIMARLREECTIAKETLSSDTDVSIPVILPSVQTEVRLTRAEFEGMIRPTLSDTIGALRRALRSAGVEPHQVGTVLLVGGSSRIPLVGQLVSTELGRPVAVDAHPKHAIALGAALATGDRAEPKPVRLEEERHDVRSTRILTRMPLPPPGTEPTRTPPQKPRDAQRRAGATVAMKRPPPPATRPPAKSPPAPAPEAETRPAKRRRWWWPFG